MANKRRISNEEIGKILFEAITKHSDRLAEHEKQMEHIIIVLHKQIEEAKRIDFKPDLNPIKTTLDQFYKQTDNAVLKVQKTLKTPNYLLYTFLVLIVAVIISGSLSAYAINTMNENSEKFNAQIKEYEEMKVYFKSFLNESHEGRKAFGKWKNGNR